MGKGKNRAYSCINESSNLSFLSSLSKCIFISHKYEDLEAAQAVADYITDYGFDVYLDDRDQSLQKAVKRNDPRKIVECIERGLNNSSHILVLVTDNTRTSWWVPYETGYAKKGKKEIASLLLKKADEFPDYLKIEAMLHGFDDLTKYLNEMQGHMYMAESTSVNMYKQMQDKHQSSLLNYIRK